MLNLKKTAVAVLALGSSAVFAGTMGPVCSSVNVTVPCESTAWDFGARALYLQPVGTNEDYSSFAANSAGKYVDYSNKWAWGFMIEGSYHFNTGNDANLNWYHLGKSATKNFASDYTLIGTAGTGFTSTGGSASVDPKWDAVNFEVGQHVDFGENKHIRFHGGVEYVRIANDVTLSTAGTYVAVPVSFSVNRQPTYNGFGPRVGADMGYDWGNGLGIYANAAAGVYAGSSKVSATITPSIGSSYFASASSTVVVPELETKLGIKYDYAMAQGDLTLDVGWLWINYFNAQRSIDGEVTGVTPAPGFAKVTSGDFGLQGLFFGLKWLGNVA